MRSLMPALLAVVVSGGVLAQEAHVDQIEVVGKGLYRVETGERTPEAGLPAGAVASPVTFTNIEKTSTVPARVGVEFGLEYKIVGEPSGAEVTLEFVNTYPGAGLADPNSPEPLRESRFKKMKPIGKVLYFGYGFENDWELVPGTWTFEIWSDGRKLAEEKFTVIK
jgi:uncharacterized protein DUF3859